MAVEMISQGSSKVNISLLVKDEDAERGIKALHAEFFPAKAANNAQESKASKQPTMV